MASYNLDRQRGFAQKSIGHFASSYFSSKILLINPDHTRHIGNVCGLLEVGGKGGGDNRLVMRFATDVFNRELNLFMLLKFVRTSFSVRFLILTSMYESEPSSLSARYSL